MCRLTLRCPPGPVLQVNDAVSRNTAQLDSIAADLDQQSFNAAEEAGLRDIIADIPADGHSSRLADGGDVAGFDDIEARLRGLADLLGDPARLTEQVAWWRRPRARPNGAVNGRSTLFPETAKGVKFKLIADDLTAVASVFSDPLPARLAGTD